MVMWVNSVYNVNNLVGSQTVNKINAIPPQPVVCEDEKVKNHQSIPFRGTDKADLKVRTKLVSKEEQEQFNNVSKLLDAQSKKMLNQLLKSGILLKNNSDDKTSVLDNLNTIATTKRAEGLEAEVILKNTIITLAKPYTINQKLGDIPESYKAKFFSAMLENKDLNINTLQEAEAKLNEVFSSTCPTASVEFNLATNHQAEFSRMVRDLTSPEISTDKIVDFRNISKNTNDAIWLLNSFKVPYEIIDANRVKVTLKPDKDAIIRAQMQTKHQNGMERNCVDVLIQSTLMQTGSQQTYNSLIDERKPGDFLNQITGLGETEKTFIETIAENKSTTSMVYQDVDENLTVTGYNCDFKTEKEQIIDTLKRGQNVIIGITFFESDKDMPDLSKSQNSIAGGHEITIVDQKTDRNGKTIFVCQDSDDEVNAPVEYPEDWLLPRIHHAGLPEDIAARTINEDKELWQYSLANYKEAKNAA